MAQNNVVKIQTAEGSLESGKELIEDKLSLVTGAFSNNEELQEKDLMNVSGGAASNGGKTQFENINGSTSNDTLTGDAGADKVQRGS